MGGLFGLGGSSSGTDRGNQLAATQGQWNLFNFGLPAGKTGVDTGQETLDNSLHTTADSLKTISPATNYWQSLLSGGRQQTMQNSAPAIDATLAGADAQKAQANNFGTGRTGGLTAANANRDATTGATIDNIVNSNLIGGKEAGAKGLDSTAGIQQGAAGLQAGVGNAELSKALSLLGLSQGSINAILQNSTQSRTIDPNIGLAIGKAVGGLYLKALTGDT